MAKRLNIFILLIFPTFLIGQDATEIIIKSEEQMKGESSYTEMKMTIVRPKWTREMTMKSWALGEDFSLTVITSPARDKGTAFLKRNREIWNWQPKIDRVIKMPPSMMMQSWMGSDFSNDDLVNQTSIVDDFTHELMGVDTIEEMACYIIKLVPLPDATVVWGSIITWIDQTDYLQIKTEFYDEDEYLVNTMIGREIKMMGGRKVPSILEVIPADDPGEKTILEQLVLDFSTKKKESFFSIQNMKRSK